MSGMGSSRFVRSPSVLTRRVGDGLLLASADDHPFEHLSSSGAAVWDALGQARSIDELARDVARTFGVEPAAVESDISTLMLKLRDLGFVVKVSDG
jgi:coenzyme PQQ synthesis protein D (PqqD)